jgi:hypothetical protein
MGQGKLCFLSQQIMNINRLPIHHGTPGDPVSGDRPFVNDGDFTTVGCDAEKIVFA